MHTSICLYLIRVFAVSVLHSEVVIPDVPIHPAFPLCLVVMNEFVLHEALTDLLLGAGESHDPDPENGMVLGRESLHKPATESGLLHVVDDAQLHRILVVKRGRPNAKRPLDLFGRPRGTRIPPQRSLVAGAGIEPATPPLSEVCSDLLSYPAIVTLLPLSQSYSMVARGGLEPPPVVYQTTALPELKSRIQDVIRVEPPSRHSSVSGLPI